MKPPENAYDSFFYVKGDWIKNLRTIFSSTVKNNNDFAASVWTGCKSQSWNTFLYFFLSLFNTVFSIVVICSVHFGTVLYLPVLFIIFTSVFGVVWLIYTCLATIICCIELIVMKIREIYGMCPSGNHHYNNPTYFCPNCNEEHKWLLPSARYGIFRRKCLCGKYLPTSRFWGKLKLKSKCPFPGCSPTASYNTGTDAKPVTIALIGGRSVGIVPHANVSASQERIEDVFETWLRSMEKDHKEQTRAATCAVLINKTDVKELHDNFDIKPGAAHDDCCKFFKDNGLDNFMALLTERFAAWRCFSVPSTGGIVLGSGQPINPLGYDEVIEWIAKKIMY